MPDDTGWLVQSNTAEEYSRRIARALARFQESYAARNHGVIAPSPPSAPQRLNPGPPVTFNVPNSWFLARPSLTNISQNQEALVGLVVPGCPCVVCNNRRVARGLRQVTLRSLRTRPSRPTAVEMMVCPFLAEGLSCPNGHR